MILNSSRCISQLISNQLAKNTIFDCVGFQTDGVPNRIDFELEKGAAVTFEYFILNSKNLEIDEI